MESLEAGTQDVSEGQSEGQTSIQDEIKDKALYEVREAEEADEFIQEYVLNDQAYTFEPPEFSRQLREFVI